MNKLYGLSFKYLKYNKHRTITTIIGVMFSAMAIYMIFTVGYSAYTATAYDTYQSSFGWDAIFNCDGETAKKILTLDSYYNQTAAMDDSGCEVANAYVIGLNQMGNAVGINDFGAMPYFFNMVYGTTPKTSNSMVMPLEDSRMAKLSVGDIQTLDLSYMDSNGDLVYCTPDKQISGIFESDNNGGGIYIEYFYDGKYDLNLNSYTWYYKMSDTDWERSEEKNKILCVVTFSSKEDIKGQAQLMSERAGGCTYYINSAALDYVGNTESLTYLAFNSVILLVAAIIAICTLFIVRNAFNISVHERNNDYGILRCIGMTRKQIVKIILSEAFVISSIGVILGMAVGHGISALLFYYVRTVVDLSAAYHVRFYIKAVLLTILYSFVTTSYAMIAPVQQLYRLNPIESLHKSEDIKGKKFKHKNGKILTKLFGVETGYAYKNVMRRKGRFCITVATLAICTVLFVSITTFLGIIEKTFKNEINSYGYDGYFGVSNYDEAVNIRNDLEKLNLADKTFLYEYSSGFVTVDSGYYDDIPQGFFLGLESDLYSEIYAVAEETATAPDNAVPIITPVWDTDHPLGSSITFPNGDETVTLFVAAKVSNDFLNNLSEEYVLYLCCTNGTPQYIYELGKGFDGPALTENGYDLISCDYELKVKLSSDKSTKAFDEFINKSTYDYIDEYEYVKLGLKVFEATKGVVIIFLILLLIMFITNNVNIKRSDMILRRDEFNTLRVIGMSYRQESKMLYSESLISSIAALIIGSIAGTLLGFGAAYGFLYYEINDLNIGASFGVNWLSILISAAVLILISILTIFLSREDN